MHQARLQAAQSELSFLRQRVTEHDASVRAAREPGGALSSQRELQQQAADAATHLAVSQRRVADLEQTVAELSQVANDHRRLRQVGWTAALPPMQVSFIVAAAFAIAADADAVSLLLSLLLLMLLLMMMIMMMMLMLML